MAHPNLNIVHESVGELRHAYEPKLGLPADTDIVWVLSAPGTYRTMATKEKGGVYSGQMYDRMNLVEGFAAVRDITAQRLGITPQEVTFQDIEAYGPTLYYNGEGEETKGSNYSQNEDLRRAMNEPDFPFPVSKIKIGEIDVANTLAQARDFGGYLRELQSTGEVGKVAVVSLTPHAPRVARYIQHQIEAGNMPDDVEFYGVPVPPAIEVTGTGVREVRKVLQYSRTGDLAERPAYTEYYRPRSSEKPSQDQASEVQRREELTRYKNRNIRNLITAPFDGEQPDAIIALSGGIRPTTRGENGFTTLSYAVANETGVVVPSKTRMIATAAIARAIPDVPIVTNSVDRTQPTWPSMASVVADELVQRGVERGRIIQEETSFNTATQLIEMLNLAVENDWRRLSVVANDWYFPRLSEFYNNLRSIVTYDDPEQNEAFHATLDRFEAMGGQVSFVSSEQVMYLEQPRFRVAVAMAQEAMAETYRSEQRGVGMLKAGTYAVSLHKPK